MAAGMSLKEKAIAGALGVVVLYAVTAAAWFLTVRKSFSSARAANAQVKKEIAAEDKLIGEKDQWDEAYLKALAAIPDVPDGRRPDAYMMAIVRKIAIAHNIKISGEKSVEKEKGSGEGVDASVDAEIDWLSIELEWTGAYETLVKFLYDLETTDKGMFDVSAINFNPMGKKDPGRLSGKMTVTCFFRRKTT